MKFYFGEDKLYNLTSRNVLDFCQYVAQEGKLNKKFDRLAIDEVTDVPSGEFAKMRTVTIKFTDMTKKESVQYEYRSFHAIDSRCGNISISRIKTQLVNG
jgi:hypothetical protein